jgi:HNH endonuclease
MKLPDRAGQPAMVQLHATLDQLPLPPGAGQPGQDAGGAAEPGTGTARHGPAATDDATDGLPEWLTTPAPPGLPSQPGWLTGAAAEAYSCDAKITPIVCGHLDRDALAAMVHAYLHGDDHTDGEGDGAECTCAARDRRARRTRDSGGRLADALTRYAISVLSGPTGLAAFLRSGLTGNFTRPASLPLDVGAATEEVPPHLRRAVISRDRHCAFPGCDRRPVLCQVHHLIPRSRGGPTRLDNLILLCSFHHLIAIHRWGWTITLHADGTTTAVSPDGTKIYHGHGPPGHDPPGGVPRVGNMTGPDIVCP